MNKGNIQDASSEAWGVWFLVLDRPSAGLLLSHLSRSTQPEQRACNRLSIFVRVGNPSGTTAAGASLDRWPNSSHDAGMPAMGGSPHGSKEKRKVALTESRPGSSLNWRGACRCWAIVLSPIEKTVAGRAAKKCWAVCMYAMQSQCEYSTHKRTRQDRFVVV